MKNHKYHKKRRKCGYRVVCFVFFRGYAAAPYDPPCAYNKVTIVNDGLESESLLTTPVILNEQGVVGDSMPPT